MASLSVEQDDLREKENEDAQIKRIKEIFVELMASEGFTDRISDIFKNKDKELGSYSKQLLKEVARRYYLDPPLVFGRLYVKERFWAKALLDLAERYKNNKQFKRSKNIAIVIEGLQEGRAQFQDDDLSEAAFNNDAELRNLREHLSFFLTSHHHNVASIQAFDKIANHARLHLHSSYETERAQKGNEKYEQLVELFQAIRNVDDVDEIERLTKIRALIEAKLDESTDENNLISNRGGFFGAYKTVSQCLNKLGFLHYEYKGRTAISTTDHLLIELVDTINDELKLLGVDPDDEPQVIVLD